MHRQRSQGAEEVLPGSRGAWESPVLFGTHFRSQGETDRLLYTFPLDLPSSPPGMGLLGSDDEGEEGGEEEIRKIYLF